MVESHKSNNNKLDMSKLSCSENARLEDEPSNSVVETEMYKESLSLDNKQSVYYLVH